MSMSALIAGRLCGKPQSRELGVTAKVVVRMANGSNCYVSVIAFSDSAKTALLALGYGAALAISGELKASAFLDKENKPRASLDLTAITVITIAESREVSDAAS